MDLFEDSILLDAHFIGFVMSQSPIPVSIIAGTRPEAIKMAPVIQAFQKSPLFQTQVILTGQHREMVDQVMAFFNLKADHDLAIMQPKQTLTDITCLAVRGLEELFIKLQPKMVLVQGDTTTAFAAALAAFYQQIPVGHVEAGLRTSDIYNPFPEEANRRLISQIAHLHFAPTELSAENVRKSGVVGEIHMTGNTVIDALLNVAASNPPCAIPGLDWAKYRVILSTVHRRENWGEPLQDILAGFLSILEAHPDTALVLAMHRNPTVRDPIQAVLGNHPRVFLTEPLDYTELIGAMKRCFMIMTDSGGIQEEAPSLAKPVLILRETTERPEAVMAGTAKLIGTDRGRMFAEANALLTDAGAYGKMANAASPFGDGRASERIVDLCAKYLGV
jgi:UDP-N-acetylglucosamine 2-epimerase (non-hydrolysing)